MTNDGFKKQGLPREGAGARGQANVDGFMPLRTLATYAGLGVRTLRAYLRHPVTPLPHFRVGGKILVRRSEYDAWMLQFRQRHASLDELVNEVLDTL